MTSAAPDPTRDSPIPVTVVFSEDVTGFTNTDITAGNGTVDDFTTVSASNYTLNLTPTSQGLITTDIPTDVAQGASSNDNAAAEQFSRIYDSIGPTGAVTSTSGSPTNAGAIGFSIAFNETVAGFESNDVTLLTSGTATGAPPALSGSGSNYTVTINNVTGNGWLGIRVDGGVCTDLLGNTNSALQAVSNQIDTVRPTCAIARVGGTPTNAVVVRFSISFSESVGGFSLGGITLTNAGSVSGLLNTLSGSGAAYTVDVSSVTGNGEIGIQVGASNAWDTAGNGNQAGARTNYVIDQTPPAVGVSAPSSTLTSTGSVLYVLTYVGADLVSLTNGDIVLNRTGTANGTADVSGSGTETRTVTISSITGDGTLAITLPVGTAWDAVGNTAAAISSAAFTVDNTAPSVNISSTSSMITGVSPIPVTVTFSEAVTGFTCSDLGILNAMADHFTAVSASIYTLDLAPGSTGVVQVDISVGVATDAIGHGNTAASSFQRIYSLVSPASISASDSVYYDKVCVTWSAASGATGYQVWRSASNDTAIASNLVTTAATTYDDLTAATMPGKILYYWVKATDGVNVSTFSISDAGHCIGTINDYDNDGKSDLALFHNGNWLIYLMGSGNVISKSFGSPGWTPVPGDYDGDGKSDLALHHNGNWLIYLMGSGNVISGPFGEPGWTPVPGDYDKDGKSDLALYHNGNWSIYLMGSSNVIEGPFGEPGWTPVSGDYDRDGKSDLALFHNGNWLNYLMGSGNVISGPFGDPGWTPVSGDYDGDGKSDLALHHNGNWLIYLMGSGNVISGPFGEPSWTPVNVNVQ